MVRFLGEELKAVLNDLATIRKAKSSIEKRDICCTMLRAAAMTAITWVNGGQSQE
jgi:hypothetical protein